MSKRISEGISSSDAAPGELDIEETGTRLVSVLFSKERDLYRVPTIAQPVWLSVKIYDPPPVKLPADAIYLGAAITADGIGWRKAYSTAWRSIIAGDKVTVPASDPMVVDYESYTSEARPRA